MLANRQKKAVIQSAIIKETLLQVTNAYLEKDKTVDKMWMRENIISLDCRASVVAKLNVLLEKVLTRYEPHINQVVGESSNKEVFIEENDFIKNVAQYLATISTIFEVDLGHKSLPGKVWCFFVPKILPNAKNGVVHITPQSINETVVCNAIFWLFASLRGMPKFANLCHQLKMTINTDIRWPTTIQILLHYSQHC